MPRVTLSTGEVAEQSPLAAEGAYPESNPSYDGEPTSLDRRVREICRGIRIEAQTPGATAAWNDVLLPHIVRQQLLAEEGGQ